MAEMLDCLVNYFSHDTNEEGMPRLYVCYQLIAGPGTTDNYGLVAITVLAANHTGIWESCQRFHAVKEGGPAAALSKTLRYLDGFHDDNYMRKVQTEFRSLPAQDQSFGRSENGEFARGIIPAPRIEPMVLRAQWDSGEPMTVLDARAEDACQASSLHIPNDVRVEHNRPDATPWPKDQLIVVYCSSPHEVHAAEVAGWLREQGFSRAYVLNGGFEGWRAADGPVATK